MSSKKHKHARITFNDSKSDHRNTSRFKEKDEETNERPCFISHLQPEILPMELMKTLLVTRGAGEDIQKEQSLERITQLFYKHITSKPQRIYRQNRRGKELTKNRGKNVSAKSDFQEDYKIMKGSNPLKSSEEKLNLDTSTTSRLKRPITCIDSPEKKIKLSSSSKSSSFDSIKIVNRSEVKKNVSEDGDKKESEKTKINDTSSISKSLVVVNKKIKLDRGGSSASSLSPKSSPEVKEEKPKKRAPIAWP
ncbi:hypothetical protein Anas_06726 [Armadillidium nasatum]|uniref:Uncharacterized protein n=1 Tax=Armadillidium nasatum TaxID=96803 RepID=A0A5N5SI44_9CRUS|nr:hypothetical protein Anas_06726 [Armadillidium nasatum]